MRKEHFCFHPLQHFLFLICSSSCLSLCCFPLPTLISLAHNYRFLSVICRFLQILCPCPALILFVSLCFSSNRILKLSIKVLLFFWFLSDVCLSAFTCASKSASMGGLPFPLNSPLPSSFLHVIPGIQCLLMWLLNILCQWLSLSHVCLSCSTFPLLWF